VHAGGRVVVGKGAGGERVVGNVTEGFSENDTELVA